MTRDVTPTTTKNISKCAAAFGILDIVIFFDGICQFLGPEKPNANAVPRCPDTKRAQTAMSHPNMASASVGNHMRPEWRRRTEGESLRLQTTTAMMIPHYTDTSLAQDACKRCASR